MYDTEFKLKIFKCKNVKSPTKAWAAAGWDFFIPEDLTLKDFVKNPSAFADKSISESFSIDRGLSTGLRFKLNNGNVFELFIKGYNSNFTFFLRDVFGEFHEYSEKEYGSYIIEKITLNSGAKVLIPSGIHVNLPNEVFLKAENKSGIASKRGLLVGASVIDCDYEGQVHINLINANHYDVVIEAGEKIVQFVRYFQPIMNDLEEFNSLEDLYKNKDSERGAGGFGSSGQK